LELRVTAHRTDEDINAVTEEQIIRMAEQAVAEMADGSDLAASLAAAAKHVVPAMPPASLADCFALFCQHFTRLARERFGPGALSVHWWWISMASATSLV
jgi:hypothetical protein